jgi:hypothetical protein
MILATVPELILLPQALPAIRAALRPDRQGTPILGRGGTRRTVPGGR